MVASPTQWHHWLDGHEFEQDSGVGDGQGSPAYCSLWGCKRVGHDLATKQPQQILSPLPLLSIQLKEKTLMVVVLPDR